MTTYGDRLRKCREESGLSQQEFGAIGAVGKTAQYQYEKNKRKPDIEYLINIAKAGYDIQYIITGIRVREPLPDDAHKVLMLYRKSRNQVKEEVIATLERGLNNSSVNPNKKNDC